MHQLGAAAGGAFGKVGLLHEQHGMATRRRIHRRTQPRGAATNDDKVESSVAFDLGNGVVTVHEVSLAEDGFIAGQSYQE